jgi:CRISPR-associated protein Cmr3
MANYLIKLTPCGKFFFGGDMRFKKGDTEDEQFSSYIIKSSTMPQQTSLLGMLRYLLLTQADESVFKDNSIQDVEKADSLIGKKSFTVNGNGAKNDFGAIKAIGPCFIMDSQDKCYFRTAATENFSSISKDESSTAFINGRSITVHKLTTTDNQTYTGKVWLSSKWKSSDGNSTITDEELFIPDQRLGIALGKNGKTDDNAFYKQHSFRMKPGFSFAFEAEVDQELPERDIVKLGADDSMFIFEAKKNGAKYPTKKSNELSIVLLSNANLPRDIEEVSYAVTSTRPFRFLSIKNRKESYAYNNNGASGFTQSLRYELYEAGSTFFFKDNEAMKKFKARLDAQGDFKQIGYNKYY